MNQKMLKFFNMAAMQTSREQSSKRKTNEKIMTNKIFVNKSQLEVASSPHIERENLRSSLQDIVTEKERDAVSDR